MNRLELRQITTEEMEEVRDQELEQATEAANEAVTEIQRVFGANWRLTDEERGDLVHAVFTVIIRSRYGK